jgi:putative ABC transport system permease protein
MYIIKNAFKTITRNKGRNILMVIIIAVIACASAVTLSIKKSANTIIDSYQSKYDITATIAMDRQSLMGNFDPGSSSMDEAKTAFQNIPSLTTSDIEKYADSSYVKSYYYTYDLSMNSSNIEKATTDSFDRGNGMNNGDFNVVGYSSYDSMTEFINGRYTITEGEVSSDFTSNTCVINQELATYNDLSVGDTITLVDPNDSTKTYDLTISGIYSENEDDANTQMSMFSNSVNNIITNTTVASNIALLDENIHGRVNPTFVLTSSDDISKYETELTSKGMSEYYKLSTNLDTISKETESVSNLSSFATTFLVITLVIGSIVLFVINMINVRERKYEIGVLRTIGMKKRYVITQFALELLIISLFGLILGAGVGSLISVPTANKLLAKEITTAQEESKNIEDNFGGMGNGQGRTNHILNSGVSNIEYVSKINAVVDFAVLIELLGIGLALTVVSSLAATISISRFSPLTILKERS